MAKPKESTVETWTAYAEADDMTFIMEGTDGVIEVVGFYFGKPDEEATAYFKGKTRATAEL